MGIYACPVCGNPNGWWSGNMRDIHDCPGPPRLQWPQRPEYPPGLDWSEVDGVETSGVVEGVVLIEAERRNPMETEHDLPNPTVARILGREEEEHPMFFERDMLEYGERCAKLERDRCAKLAEAATKDNADIGYRTAGEAIADAIRGTDPRVRAQINGLKKPMSPGLGAFRKG